MRVAAPLLEAGAQRDRPAGAASRCELIGADREPVASSAARSCVHTDLAPFGGIGAVVLPAPLARTIGVRKFGQEVTFQLAGHTVQAPLYAQLHAQSDRPA